MRVQVGHVGPVQAGGVTVTFDSPFGWASAIWVGPPPQIGVPYDVELEVPGILTWGTEIVDAEAKDSIFQENGHTCVVGTVQSLSDDGVTAIQVGDDTVLVETTGAPLEVPRKVIIKVPEIKLFDAGL